ncbi:MAG TPA: prepilin-type N-terminal cleavage/methylation domain-containing protein [Egibacteraceae bacterium]|jgi:hypothetical protein|nr:prepilin-type N-terminal cleavage/methylation domain-containing protein [Egibacteraceae bacterium]
MKTTLRRRLAGDDGISLVEMLVAFAILGVVMSASAGFFTTALGALQQAEGRTKATALANEELENLRVLPWDRVGFYGDDNFGQAMPAGTVVLEARRPAATRAPLPVETIAPRGGVVFTVRRSITWIDNTQTSQVGDYKRLVVAVDWSDRGVPRSITVESLRTPNPDEQTPSDFVLSLLEVRPTLVYLNADGTLDAARNGQLDLASLTSAKADFVVARYVQRGASANTVQSLGSTDRLNWAGAVTGAHGHTFPNGDVLFTFVATRATPYEQEVLGTTLVRFLQPVAVTSLDVAPTSVCVAPSQPTPPVRVAMHIDGLVEEDVVTVSWSGGTTKARMVEATQSGSSLEAEIPGGSYGGSTTVTVTGVRGSDGATATAASAVSVTVDEECAL